LGVGQVANNSSLLKKTHVENYSQDEMLPLQTKQSGSKLLCHSDLRGGVLLEEVSHSRKRWVAGTCGYDKELLGSIKMQGIS
jgi:hypothetical protein